MKTTANAKHRILSLALALCLALGMTLYLPGPVTAEAAGPYDDEFDFNSVSDITFVLSHHGGNYLVHSNGTAQAKEIAVGPGVTVSITVRDVSADVGSINGSCAFSIGAGAEVYLTLEGTNVFQSGRDRAGLEVHENATLVITGDSTGALEARGGDDGAGIGGATNQDGGALVIQGGDVTAYGGYYAAGIGGGSKGSGGAIFISGGTVEAHGGTTGAGIGSGVNASGSGSVVIEGGDVSAYGDQSGAGIGGGQGSRGDSIRISGGTVFAKGYALGAGIGGGGLGGSEGGTITIEGGHVTTAVDNDYPAGIGGGSGLDAGKAGTVRISGGVVNTTRIGPGRSNYDIPARDGSSGSLVITGGSLYLDDSLKNDTPLNGMGETLHRSVLQVGDPPVGAADVTGGSVSTAPDYSLRDVRTDSSGSVSFWLPAVGDTNVRLTVGGLTYGETFQMLPGNSNTAVLTTSGVTGVAVDPDTAQRKRGEQQQFTATVSVVGGADRTVQWSVDGTDSSIDANGLLTVGADEAADTLTVRAVSDFDPSAWGEAVVTVTEDDPGPSVSKASLELEAGESDTFFVSLGKGNNGAHTATITSENAQVATATPTQLTQATATQLAKSETITVTGVAQGDTEIRVSYSGGLRDGESDTVQVTVTDPDDGGDGDNGNGDGGNTGGSSATRSSSAGHGGSADRGGTTPDIQRTKTTLPASAFSWDGRALTIDHDSVTPLGLQSVEWNGQTLERGRDYSVHSGSVIVRFDADFIGAQSPGAHTVRVEFLNHTGETTVTVGETSQNGEPNDDLFLGDTYNPNTGGMGTTDNPNTGHGGSIWPVLLLGSLSGVVLVKLRPRLRVKE